jgi:hypothetical protein
MGAELVTAVATCAIAVFTYTLWRSTNKLWEAGEANANRQLRAYVSVSAKELTGVFTGATPTIVLTVTNAGHTPATHVMSWCRIHFVEWPCKEEPCIETTNLSEGSISILGPGQPTNIGDDLRRYLTAEEVVKLRPKGGYRLLIKGQIAYRDVFGDSHLTMFRLLSWGVGDSADGEVECRWADSGNEMN